MTSQPLVLITDTNIWIDLDHGELLELIFHLPYQICAADFAKAEIRSIDVTVLERQGLIFQGLDKTLMAELLSLRQRKTAIAIADLEAFLLAREQGAVLVTGDRNLARLAMDEGLEVHGLLWLMDEMVQIGVLRPLRAAASLSTIIDRGARLPADECDRRIRIWSK